MGCRGWLMDLCSVEECSWRLTNAGFQAEQLEEKILRREYG